MGGERKTFPQRPYDLAVTWPASTDELEFWVLSIGTVAVGLCYGAGESGRRRRGIFDECGCHAVTTKRGWPVDFGTSLSGPYLQPAPDDIVLFSFSSHYSIYFSSTRFLACVATLFHLVCRLIYFFFFWRALYFQQGFFLLVDFLGLGDKRVPVLLA